jgi:DNA invertase Pin-like site-specific DNA recombinase
MPRSPPLALSGYLQRRSADKALGKAIAALGDGDVLLVTRLDRATQREMPAVAPIFDGEKEAKLIFHTGYERAVGLRRDDPVLAAMGLESVFF